MAGRPIVNQRNKNMKLIKAQIRTLAGAVLLMGAGLSGCSTGTKDGDVSVEKGDPKDKDPTEHNENAQGQPPIDTSTTENMAKPYEKTDGAPDKDADGMADQPGTKSEHTTPEDQQRKN
jgi:hypothetical protein